MAELEQELSLRIDSALQAVAQLDRALIQTAGDAGEAMATELAKGVQIDATPITTAVTSAVEDADTAVTVEDVDAAIVTTTIDESVTAADTDVVVDSAEAGVVTTSIEGAAEAADTALIIDQPSDASAITDAIDAAVAEADTSVVLELDTGDAEQQLAGLSDVGDNAAESLGKIGQEATGAASATGAVGTAADVASSAVSVLGGNFSSIAAKAGPAGAAVVGVSTALGVFVGKAISSTETTARFTATFGELAPAILQVDIGGLNVELAELTAQVGASGVGLKAAASDFGQLAIASGQTQEEAAATAEQLIALSAAASVLKPSLGAADQVIGGLTNALARGGRSLAEYGISLTAAEIQQRAMTNTGKSTAAELTQVEKATAGAQLATEQYGDTLDDVVEKGSKNASVQLRALKTEAFGAISALGTPLIGPVLDVLKSAAPAIASIVKLIGLSLQVLSPIIQGVSLILQGLGPVIKVVVGAFEVLTAPIRAVAAGLQNLHDPLTAAKEVFSEMPLIGGLFKKSTEETTEAVGESIPVLSNFADAGVGVQESFAAMEKGLTPVPALVSSIAQTIKVELPGIASAFEKASEDSTVSLQSFQVALREQLVAEQQFFANLSYIIAAGGLQIAELLASQGPERGAAAAKAIAVATPIEIRALEQQAAELSAFEYGRGVEISTRLGEGFAMGIQKALGSIRESTNQLKSVVDKAFQIRSPSRWAMERGEMIGEGLALGITSSLPRVEAALGQLDRYTVGGASNGTVNVTSGAALAGSAGASSGTTVVIAEGAVQITAGSITPGVVPEVEAAVDRALGRLAQEIGRR